MKIKQLCIAVLLLSGANAGAASSEHFLQYAVNDIFQPRSAKLAASSLQLLEKTRQACKQNQEFASVKAAWQQSYLDWKRLAALNWGPGANMRISRVIAFHPARPLLIEDAVRQSASGEKRYEDVGAAAKGLAAVEYLLHAPQAMKDSPRCAWLLQVSEEIYQQSQQLATSWQAIATESQSGKSSPQLPDAPLALEELFNLSLAGSNELLKELSRLDGSKPEALTGYRSGLGRELMRAQFSQIRALMQGGAGDGAIVALLQDKKPPLAARLSRQLALVDEGLQRLPAQLAQAKGRQQPAVRALQDLLDLLEGDVATTLDLTLSFNESDGD